MTGQSAPTSSTADLAAQIADLRSRLATLERVAPSNTGRQVARAVGSAAQTGIGSTPTDLTGCSVTFNADPNRRYRTWIACQRFNQSTAAGSVLFRIADAGGGVVNGTVHSADAGQSVSLVVSRFEPSLSGPIVRKAQVATTAGTVGTTAGWLPEIWVEDVGPA